MLSDQKIKFLMRFQKSFNQLIDESKQEDYYTDLNYQKKTYKVLIIKLKLSSDEIEVLVIKQFKLSEFMERCFKRWPSKPNTTPLKIN